MYTLGMLDCEMRWQPLTVPSMGWPPNLLAKVRQSCAPAELPGLGLPPGVSVDPR